MHACTYVRTYVRMYAFMQVCMYVLYMYVHVCMCNGYLHLWLINGLLILSVQHTKQHRQSTFRAHTDRRISGRKKKVNMAPCLFFTFEKDRLHTLRFSKSNYDRKRPSP